MQGGWDETQRDWGRGRDIQGEGVTRHEPAPRSHCIYSFEVLQMSPGLLSTPGRSRSTSGRKAGEWGREEHGDNVKRLRALWVEWVFSSPGTHFQLSSFRTIMTRRQYNLETPFECLPMNEARAREDICDLEDSGWRGITMPLVCSTTTRKDPVAIAGALTAARKEATRSGTTPEPSLVPRPHRDITQGKEGCPSFAPGWLPLDATCTTSGGLIGQKRKTGHHVDHYGSFDDRDARHCDGGGIDDGLQRAINIQFTEGMTVTVSGFDSQKYTGTVLFSPHSTDQAYAHVIEGKKASSTSSTTTAASSSLAAETSGTAAAATATATPDSSSSNSIGGGAIAGAVVGSIAGVALIVLAIFLLFRRRRNHNGAGQQPIDYSSEIAAANQANGYHGDNAYPAGAAYNQEEKALPSIPDAASNHDPISPYAQSPPGYNNYAELPVNHAVELASPQESHPNMGELDGGYQGSELQNASQNHGPNHGHTTH
ncbi:hypothetical protein SCAR479_03790 [Seiridium cardinale]|uniref:Uncharacterized protein n=1 Tax=Seiridium cardinale TaxID=138064 RepID=A0ABR2XZS8_9PEZI